MKAQICSSPPSVFRSAASGKTYAVGGDTFVEVPAGTTIAKVGRYLMTKQQMARRLIEEKRAMHAYMSGATSACPECGSVDSDVYPDSNGKCRCGACNDLPPEGLRKEESAAKGLEVLG